MSSDDGSKSSLSRSHSSPNIANMLDNENIHNNINNRSTRPDFSRSLKPMGAVNSDFELQQARSRDFQPIWSTTKQSLTGLRNLGNTCYMNSIIQCLSNFTILSKFFMDGKYQELLNERSKTHGEIAIEFGTLVRTLWSGHYKTISPKNFKQVIGRYKENFRGTDQQDAHELLVTLMEWLHNDINEVKVKVTLPEQKNDGVPEIEAAKAAWEAEKQADKSFIRELFYGQWRSSLTCQTCRWASVKYESFFELAVPIPGNGSGRWRLDECIDKFLSPEVVTYNCPRCKRDRDCVKKFDIVKLPTILTIQLVRFYNDGLWRKKQNFIDFPLESFQLGRYATACDGKLNHNQRFSLFAVCNHFGSMEGGHYTAYCLTQPANRWFKFDDQEVNEMHASDVVTSAAYVLFYTTRNK